LLAKSDRLSFRYIMYNNLNSGLRQGDFRMLVFGFDIGTTSIGSAVARVDGEAQERIPHTGVRIFPEARDPEGTPLNQQRRAKRMARRQLRRRRQRRRALNGLLADAGLLPRFDSAEWRTVMAIDPYELRRRGLSEPLTPYELGRALYHIAKRRHFKARDLEEGEAEDGTPDDEKRATSAREETVTALKTRGVTLGQWLAEKPEGERRRGVHATRQVVAKEFEKMLDAQSDAHAPLRDSGFRADIEQVIFSQRPVFWRKRTLGECPLEPGAELCPKGAWLSQQRRMLEKLNNLMIAGGNSRPLDDAERAAILAKLQAQQSMTWTSVRRALEPLFRARDESARLVKFNLELGGDDRLPGNMLEAKLAQIFGTEWSTHPHRAALRQQVHRRLWTADYGEIGTQRVVIRDEADRQERRREARFSFIRDFGVTDLQADALASITFPQGWEPFSFKALEKMLPELERGVRMGTLLAAPEKIWVEWREKNFPNRKQPTGEYRDRLPSPSDKDEALRIASLRNPTVVRVQNELRKVVNNLIAVHGKPDLIRVEIARTVGLSKRERAERDKANRDRERNRKKARNDLASKGLSEPSRDDIVKWLLWKECGEFDPYSGLPIGFDDLFKNNAFQVEHIWPRPVSLDDSFANKTLCHRDWNLRKAKRTPFEAFGNTDEWAAMKERVWKRVHAKDMPMSKRKATRFCWDKSLPEDFTNRQLNDTGWAAREVVKQLKRLWPDVGPTAPVTVQPVSGRVTAHLRRLWGLNNILSDDGEKTRADHRHHAIDALVVACAHPGVTQQLSRYWQALDDPRRASMKPPLEPPWPTIRRDAEKSVEAIIVSHKVRKKVSGPLHDEMPLGYTNGDVVKNGKRLGIYRKRMPVEKLSLATLKIERPEDITRSAKFVIRDRAVRKALAEHLERAGVPPEKAYPPYPRVSSRGPEIRKVRVLTTQQKELMVPAANGYADPSNNHHIAIYRLPNGNTTYDTVSLYRVARRLSQRKPVVERQRDGAHFVMSLAPGETIEFLSGERKGYWIVNSVWASGQVEMTHHIDSTGATKFRPTAGGILAESARKVSVDPIGRVRPASD
jgi:CRISPR-associated endonuclease Csn1